MKSNESAFPRLARRDFFRVGAITIAGYTLLPVLKPFNVQANRKEEPRGGAETVIFYHLLGGMSHVDTFDLKEGKWTPEDLDVRTVRPGLKMPCALYPRLAQRMDKLAVVRSMEAWEILHERGQYYLQVAHAFSPARLKEMPNAGSVIAYEFDSRRKASDFLPPFITLNPSYQTVAGPGVLPAMVAPMMANTKDAPPFILKDEAREEVRIRRELLDRLDGDRHGPSERGRAFQDYASYYRAAYRLLDAPSVNDIFHVSEEDHKRYGSTSTGDACAIARNLVSAKAGARVVYIGHNGWDLHNAAWSRDKEGKTLQGKLCLEMDGALATLIEDLESKKETDGRTLLEKTLVVCMGEFGRTPGELNPRGGRDHHRQAHTALFAGGGVIGGKVIGATNDVGSRVAEPGWHANRSIYFEDVFATVYSAMGIDWTKKITETPSGRPFYYIDDSSPVGSIAFAEISELFKS